MPPQKKKKTQPKKTNHAQLINKKAKQPYQKKKKSSIAIRNKAHAHVELKTNRKQRQARTHTVGLNGHCFQKVLHNFLSHFLSN